MDQAISNEEIVKITRVIGYVPLEVRNFFQFKANRSDLNECLQHYKRDRKANIQAVLQFFLRQSKDHYKNMTLALQSLLNQEVHDSSLTQPFVDQRYFYIDKSQERVFALSPIATEALRNIIFEPSNIDQVIKLCEKNASVIGFILEQELQKEALKWLASPNFVVLKLRNKYCQKELGTYQLIDSDLEIENFGEKFESNIFDILKNKGYHALYQRFPIIDGILVQDNKLILIQIKRVARNGLNEMFNFWISAIENFLKSEKAKHSFESLKKNPDAHYGVTKDEVAHFILTEALIENKSLDIVFITTNISPDEFYFKNIKKKGKALPIRFLLLDPLEALQYVGLSSKSLEIISVSYEKENY